MQSQADQQRPLEDATIAWTLDGKQPMIERLKVMFSAKVGHELSTGALA